MKALSDCLYLTPLFYQELQEAVIGFLKGMLERNNLPRSLQMFKKNSMLVKDFCESPSLPGFDNINKILVGLVCNVKIVQYSLPRGTMNLQASLINSKFERVVQIYRSPQNQYCGIYSRSKMNELAHAQNVVLSIVESVLNETKEFKYMDLNEGNFMNFAAQNEEQPQPSPERRRHKKSLSESNLFAFEDQENERPISFGNLFLSPTELEMRRKTGEVEKPETNLNLPRQTIRSDSSQMTKTSLSARGSRVMKTQLSAENDLFSFLASPSSDDEKNDKKRQGQPENIQKLFFKEEVKLIDEQEGNYHVEYPSPFEGIMDSQTPHGITPPKVVSGHEMSMFYDNQAEVYASQQYQSFNHPIVEDPYNRFLPPIRPLKHSVSSQFHEKKSSNRRTEREPQLKIHSMVSHGPFDAPSQAGIETPLFNDFGGPSKSEMSNAQPLGPVLKGTQSYSGFSANPGSHKEDQFHSTYHSPHFQSSFSGNYSVQSQSGFITQPSAAAHPDYHYKSPMSFSTQSQPNPTTYGESYTSSHQGGFPQETSINRILGFPANVNTPLLFQTGETLKSILSESLEEPKDLHYHPFENSKRRTCGRLKFFDEAKNYGFIISDEDGSDIFVHFDDLCKAGITKELLKTAKLGNMIRLSFSCLSYIGRHNRSRKAVDLQVISTTY